jgi:membrane protein involved in D-alanine export
MEQFYLHGSLPFSDAIFYLFAGATVVLTFMWKWLAGSNAKIYRYWLLLISLVYCLLLYTNPLGIALFIAYGYGIYYFLSRRSAMWNSLTVILYILPLFLNKLLHIVPDFKTDVRTVLQIAGISYMTFKMLQIHFDERHNAVISVDRFVTFLAFPATLLIGPIDRFKRFNNDLDAGFSLVNQENLIKGFNFLVRGLLYKYIVASAIQTLLIAHLPQKDPIWYHVLHMYTYLFYLFFDFAGYSLLAMGFGNMLGINVPFNFDKPFLAANPKEFWQRWHKSLGDWLNDYFFKPIFKELTTRKVFTPIQRQSLALFLTFTLMGFWNGFELHYIASGMLFGIYSVVHNYYQIQCKKQNKDVIFGKLNERWVRVISIGIFFHLVAFSIYIFSGNLF